MLPGVQSALGLELFLNGEAKPEIGKFHSAAAKMPSRLQIFTCFDPYLLRKMNQTLSANIPGPAPLLLN